MKERKTKKKEMWNVPIADATWLLGIFFLALETPLFHSHSALLRFQAHLISFLLASPFIYLFRSHIFILLIYHKKYYIFFQLRIKQTEWTEDSDEKTKKN